MTNHGATTIMFTPLDKELLNREEDKIKAIVSCLEAEWKLQFVKNIMRNRTELYVADFGNIHCRITLEPRNLVGRISFTDKTTNKILYHGLLKDDENYYPRLLKSFKKEKSWGSKNKRGSS